MLIDLLLHRYTFDNIAKLDDTGNFGENRHCIRVPAGHEVTFFDLIAFFNYHFTVTVHDNEGAVGGFDGNYIPETYRSTVSGFERALLCPSCRGSTDMESTHRQLGSRLTDRLSGDDSDRFTNVDQSSSGQVASVTISTDTTF